MASRERCVANGCSEARARVRIRCDVRPARLPIPLSPGTDFARKPKRTWTRIEDLDYDQMCRGGTDE